MNVRVRNMDGKYFDGIIGTKSFHAMPVEERMTVIKLYDCYIDIGARSKKEVEELGIRCGCAITYRPHFQRMLNDRYSGTSIDDRSQVAAMIKVAENLSFASSQVRHLFRCHGLGRIYAARLQIARTRDTAGHKHLF